MKSRTSKILSIVLIISILCLINTTDLLAQCPMCRMTAESNLAQGGVEGQGLNNGILYMLITPYLLVGGLAYFWWRNKRREKEVFDV